MKKTALLLVLTFTFACMCHAQNVKDEFKVDISDNHLAMVIREYVAENHIDAKRRVITLKIVTGQKKTVTITNEIGALYCIDGFVPTYYGVLDGKILFLAYAHVDNLFKRDLSGITKEIANELKKLGVKLESRKDGVLNKTYSAPTWRLTEELTGYMLNKKVTPHEFASIPQGYAIVRDSIELDNLVLIKR